VLTHFDNPVVPEKASGKAREVWLLQTNDAAWRFFRHNPKDRCSFFVPRRCRSLMWNNHTTLAPSWGI